MNGFYIRVKTGALDIGHWTYPISRADTGFHFGVFADIMHRLWFELTFTPAGKRLSIPLWTIAALAAAASIFFWNRHRAAAERLRIVHCAGCRNSTRCRSPGPSCPIGFRDWYEPRRKLRLTCIIAASPLLIIFFASAWFDLSVLTKPPACIGLSRGCLWLGKSSRPQNETWKIESRPFDLSLSCTYSVQAATPARTWTTNLAIPAATPLSSWSTKLPLWLALVPPLTLAAACTLLNFLQRRRERDRCRACGYDLSGLPPHAPCPECGKRH
jgi:hypothetical protein